MLENINISSQEFITVAHKTTAIPNLIILYIMMGLIFLIVGLFSVKESRGRLMLIVILSMIFSAVILIALILLPNLGILIKNFIFRK